MIRAVLFDLDGVVRHFDPAHVARIEARHRILSGSIERFAFSSPLIEQVTTGAITRREWVLRIAEHLGNIAAAEEWGDQPSRPDPEVLDLADELRDLGLLTPILTNGTDTMPAEVEALGLNSRFDPVFNSASIGYIKPDRRAFTHILRELEMTAGEVFFTDDSDRKLAGAAELGMIVHHFTGVRELRRGLSAEGIPVR